MNRWIAYDEDFSPNKTDFNFKKWTKKGLVKYNDLYHKDCLKLFKDKRKAQYLENKDLDSYKFYLDK